MVIFRAGKNIKKKEIKNGRRFLTKQTGGKKIMTTLDELKKENKRLRSVISSQGEMEKIGKERNRLLKENKALLKQAKFGKAISIGKTVGLRVGRGAVKGAVKTAKVGAKIWKVLGDLERQRLKNEAARRRVVRSVKRKKKR